jgi:NADPH:quinone reductase-like Zn-dependent oxidoreductase
MKTVKAARIHSYGGPEELRIEDLALSEPRANELLIRIYAAGVNPIDWKIRNGYMRQKIQLPFTAGFDFAGVVEETGPDVVDLKSGGEVYGQAGVLNGGSGTFAQFSLAKRGTIATKPQTTNHVEAAGLPLAGVSAVQALTEHIGLSQGERILIHGGAGGIGSIAIQLARHLGAHVITTVSAVDTGYVMGLGAQEVIDYKAGKFEEVLGDLEAVFDTVGGDTYARSFKVLKRGGRLVSMLEQPNQALMKEYGVSAVSQFTQVNTERLTKLAELIDRGAVRVHVDKTFPLDQAAAALAHVETKSPRGKVVLVVV